MADWLHLATGGWIRFLGRTLYRVLELEYKTKTKKQKNLLSISGLSSSPVPLPYFNVYCLLGPQGGGCPLESPEVRGAWKGAVTDPLATPFKSESQEGGVHF